MKKWWSLPPKVTSAALTHHGKRPVKGEPLTLSQVVSISNCIANMNEFAHPVTTAFEDSPERGIWMLWKSARRNWMWWLIPR